MKHSAYIFVISAVAAALLLPGCAKTVVETDNQSAQRYFLSYIKVHYGDQYVMSDYGTCVVKNEEGDGECVDGYDIVFGKYTKYDFDGTITATTYEEKAKQIGTYRKSNFYGSFPLMKSDMYAGIEESMSGMKVGGKRTVLIPKWLMTYNRYATLQEYFDHTSDVDHCIFEIEVTGCTEDITQWELDTLGKYIRAQNFEKVDTVAEGFYLARYETAQDTTVWAADTTFNVNYTGRLLSGAVFDTSIKDTAKVHNLYSPSATYSPKAVVWKTNREEITFDGSTNIITGFNIALSKMRRGETVIAMFTSDFGYKASGSGEAIPPYSPLVFKIEMVK